MERTANITFKSMFVRGDGDTDFFFAGKDPGELYYTILVEKIKSSGQSETLLKIERTRTNQIQKFSGGTISQQELTSGMPFKQFVPDFVDFDLEAGSKVKIKAEIREDDGLFGGDFAGSNRVFDEKFVGDFPNETLRVQNKKELDIDLLYSVRVTEIPGLIQIPDPVKDAGITQTGNEVKLKGVEMFTSREFQLPPFGRGFSEVFPVGEYPILRQQIPSSGKPADLALQLIGILDNNISSIKVGKGFKVTIFMDPDFGQTTGKAITLTANVADLGLIWDNKISSFIVGELPIIPPPK